MITLDAIELPENLYWQDEYRWTPVVQTREYSLTGALVVEEGIRQAGRPVTLTTPEGGGWISRTTVEALRATLDDEATLTLTLHDGRAISVRWRHDDIPIEAEPILPGLADPDATALYRITLRFIEV